MMKGVFLGLVAVFLLSFQSTNSVTVEIDGSPTCFEANKEYVIRVVGSEKLEDYECYRVTGSGISLTLMKKNVYRGKVSNTSGPVKIWAHIQNKKDNTSVPVSKLEINVCN